MNRKKFIQLSGTASLAMLAAPSILANTSRALDVISIDQPKIHVRHGLFDLHKEVSKKGRFYIQRDILTKNGLQEASNEHITSIKIVDNKNEIFGVLNNGELSANSDVLESVRVQSNEPLTMRIRSQSLIIPEWSNLNVDDVEIGNNEALMRSEGEVKITSKCDQHVFILRISNHQPIG
ncbi:MAG: hypothetical protein AAGA02_08490 [Bacteroidota bacterium]